MNKLTSYLLLPFSSSRHLFLQPDARLRVKNWPTCLRDINHLGDTDLTINAHLFDDVIPMERWADELNDAEDLMARIVQEPLPFQNNPQRLSVPNPHIFLAHYMRQSSLGLGSRNGLRAYLVARVPRCLNHPLQSDTKTCFEAMNKDKKRLPESVFLLT